MDQTIQRRTMINEARNGYTWLLYSLLIVLILVPSLVKLVYYPTYPGSDDAFIHLEVARNFAEGNGWGINAGEPVNLSSSPLFTLLLTLVNALGLDLLTTGKALALLFCAAGLLLLYLILTIVTESTVLRLSGVALGAFDVHLWRWNGVIMETTLALLFVYLVFYLYYRRQQLTSYESRSYLLIGLATGLATLVRFELTLLLGCVLLDFLCNEREERMRGATMLCLGFFVAIVPWYAFSYAYFDSLLPTTFYAKTSGLQWINFKIARQVGTVVLSAYGLPLLAAFALLAYTVRTGPWRGVVGSFQPFLAILLFPLSLCAFYYLKTEGLQSPSRYVIPALAALPLVCIIMVEKCRERVNVRTLRAIALTIVILNAAIAVGLNQIIIAPVLRSFDENYWTTMRHVSSFLTKRTATNDVVLVKVDIGILSYYNRDDFYISDGGGLASPELGGLSVSEQIARVDPKYIVESIGQNKGALAKNVPNLELVHYRRYAAHGTQQPGEWYFCNIYRPKPTQAIHHADQ